MRPTAAMEMSVFSWVIMPEGRRLIGIERESERERVRVRVCVCWGGGGREREIERGREREEGKVICKKKHNNQISYYINKKQINLTIDIK